jgi:hypothetical protein
MINATAGHPIVIGHHHLEVGMKDRLKVLMACRFGGDEWMCGARVTEGGDGGVAEVDEQLHCLSGGDSRDGIEGNLQRGVVKWINGLWCVQF